MKNETWSYQRLAKDVSEYAIRMGLSAKIYLENPVSHRPKN